MRKGWCFMVLPDSIAIFPTYNGQCGCRLWYVRTIGL